MKSSEEVREKNRMAVRKYRAKNRESINAKVQKYYHENQKVDSTWVRTKNLKNKKWQQDHHESYMFSKRKYEQKRYHNDPCFRLKHILQRRVTLSIKKAGGRKCAKTMELTGCSIEQLRSHIERLWQPGMSWSNHGRNGWHIDHIVPCDSFDLLNESEQRTCFHYSNLQPLWAKDNLAKTNKF